MKPLTVTAKVRNLKDLIVPNLDSKDPAYTKKAKAILKYKETQPELHHKIMFWD